MERSIKPSKVIAEIGTNHVGDINRAKELIKLAYICGCDYAKFQKRCPEESTPKHLQNQKHPNEIFSYGETYLEHRKNIELNIEQHVDLYNYCNNLGIKYSTSVWDITSAKEVISKINPEYIKIPSACNLNFKLLDYIFMTYSNSVHISLGMINNQEIDQLVLFLNRYKFSNKIVLYHCTSEYPCSFEHIYINSLLKIKEFGYEVGFSNHGFGIATDIVAMLYGARFIERHFTSDRTFRHSDSRASLEPDGMRRLCRDLKNVYKTLQYKTEITEEENKQKHKLKYD